MKSKRLFHTHLIIVFLCCVIIGFGLPNDSEAGNCYIEGYVVQMLHVGGTVSGFWIREKPIDAGMWAVIIHEGAPMEPEVVAMYNTIRSSYQNNSKLAILTMTLGACPTPDLSMPGQTNAGYLWSLGPPS